MPSFAIAASPLLAAEKPIELHLYQHGDHGTGLICTQHPWFADLIFWLRARAFVR